MQEHKRPIFRSEALRRYLSRQEATVIPRLVMPRSLASLWIVLPLVMAASLTILSMDAPVYSSGVAIAVTRGGNAGAEAVLAALAPGEQPNTYQPGNAAVVELAKNRPPVIGSIIEVEKTQIGSSEAAARFGLSAEARSAIRFPTSVVFVRLTAGGGDLLRPDDRNVVYRVQVQHGQRRAISYVISAITKRE